MLKNLFFIFLLCFSIHGGLFAADAEMLPTRRFGIFAGSNSGGRDRVMLRYAISDARALSNVFTGMGGITAEDSFLLAEPSVRELNRQFDYIGSLIAQSKRNNQRTELIFYYSGHSDEAGLLLNRERLPYQELRNRIEAVQADMRIVILDSCSSGAITRAKGGVKVQPFLFDNSVSAEGFAILTSSSADEVSQESDIIESSYFTHSLLAGLRGAADLAGDGRVTLNELYRYAFTETLSKTETSIYGIQHPNFDIQLAGTGDVVLTDIRENSSSILFSADISGRISIRDSSDFLVAELTKIANRPLELGLEAGWYNIILQQGDNFYRAEKTLNENQRITLGMGDFRMIAASKNGRTRGEEADAVNQEPVSGSNIYSFFVNIVYEPFRFPLFGFINIAHGNHKTPHFGLLNWNTGDFKSMQAGFININGGSVTGLQASFINTAGGNINGVQSGFINTVVGDTEGLQAGFINTNAGGIKGLQAGFINTVKGCVNGVLTGFINTAIGDTVGLQAGFINTNAGGIKGLQAGFINTVVKEGLGSQIGFINTSVKKFSGMQIGFINYADSIEKGIPIGFISIVRHGGYHAVEYNFTEFYPFGIGLKLGVDKFYTNIIFAYSPKGKFIQNRFASGFGLGTLIPINKFIFINPELSFMTPAWYEENNHKSINWQQLTSFVPFFGFNVGKHFSVAAGPSVTWMANYSDDLSWQKPLFKIAEGIINENHRIVIGARASLRLRF